MLNIETRSTSLTDKATILSSKVNYDKAENQLIVDDSLPRLTPCDFKVIQSTMRHHLYRNEPLNVILHVRKIDKKNLSGYFDLFQTYNETLKFGLNGFMSCQVNEDHQETTELISDLKRLYSIPTDKLFIN